jgi:hypothetical protein
VLKSFIQGDLDVAQDLRPGKSRVDRFRLGKMAYFAS